MQNFGHVAVHKILTRIAVFVNGPPLSILFVSLRAVEASYWILLALTYYWDLYMLANFILNEGNSSHSLVRSVEN